MNWGEIRRVKKGLPLAMVVHVRVRGGQRGLKREGSILTYKPGEGRAKPTFLPAISTVFPRKGDWLLY